ncbi:hypothetical protein RCO48_26440 [Peribacillus frigoritolerans]|nr:hypothetical protein [Peribacillus frigoritolerans]
MAAMFYQNNSIKGFVSKQDLIGMKWVENKATVMFFSLNKQKVSVEIMDPKTNIKVLEQQKETFV